MERVHRAAAVVAVACIAASVLGGCGSTAPTQAPASTAPPPATYYEWRDAYCAAWTHLFTAVGNPDTAAASVLVQAMEEAIDSQDATTVDLRAFDIRTELENGRLDVARGAGWTPAIPMMEQLDRIFVAYEVMTEAKRTNVKLGLSEARELGQKAFVDAGAGDAWTKLLHDSAIRGSISAARPANEPPFQCPGVPVSA